jgi:hypothetical protein
MLQLFVNQQAHAPVQKVERIPHLPGELLAIHVAPAQAKALTAFIEGRHKDSRLLSRVPHGDHHILLFEQLTADPQLINTLNQKFGGTLKQSDPAKQSENQGIDLMKVRGYLGLFGQILQNMAARKEINPEMLRAASVSLASNVVTVVYGTQQRIDDKKTRILRDRTDDIFSHHIDRYNPPDDKELSHYRERGSTLQEADRFMHANATIISDGMKLISQLVWSNTAKNPVDKLLAMTQSSAKIVTFSGLDKDKDTPNSEKSWLTRLREQSNPISGGMEFAAQFMNLFQSLYVPQIHDTSFQNLHHLVYDQGKGIKEVKHHYRPMHEIFSLDNWKRFNPAELRIISPIRFAAVMLFLSGFAAKMAAPFSETSVDWEDVHTHVALALRQLPENKKSQTLGELSLAYLESFPDQHMSFGEIYQSLRQGIEKTQQEGKHSAAVRGGREQLSVQRT